MDHRDGSRGVSVRVNDVIRISRVIIAYTSKSLSPQKDNTQATGDNQLKNS